MLIWDNQARPSRAPSVLAIRHSISFSAQQDLSNAAPMQRGGPGVWETLGPAGLQVMLACVCIEGPVAGPKECHSDEEVVV